MESLSDLDSCVEFHIIAYADELKLVLEKYMKRQYSKSTTADMLNDIASRIKTLARYIEKQV